MDEFDAFDALAAYSGGEPIEDMPFQTGEDEIEYADESDYPRFTG